MKCYWNHANKNFCFATQEDISLLLTTLDRPITSSSLSLLSLEGVFLSMITLKKIER